MWGCAENDTKQAKVNSEISIVKYNGIVKSSQTANYIPDVPPSNTASFGHPWKSYLTSHFSIGIHASYGQCTSLGFLNGGGTAPQGAF